MIEKMPAKLLTFKNEGEHPYDQPTSARQLMGIMRYINDFTSREYNTLHPMSDDNLMSLFFNCHKQSVLDVLAKPIKRDYAEVSFSQNLLDNLGIPPELKIDVKDIMENKRVKGFLDENPDYKKMVPDGQISFVRDPRTIDQLKFGTGGKDLKAPRITNSTNHKLSSLTPRHEPLDRIDIRQNILI